MLEGDRALLLLEHGVDEELVQLLIGVVDAELLEGVVREDFKAEDVEKIQMDGVPID